MPFTESHFAAMFLSLPPTQQVVEYKLQTQGSVSVLSQIISCSRSPQLWQRGSLLIRSRESDFYLICMSTYWRWFNRECPNLTLVRRRDSRFHLIWTLKRGTVTALRADKADLFQSEQVSRQYCNELKTTHYCYTSYGTQLVVCSTPIKYTVWRLVIFCT